MTKLEQKIADFAGEKLPAHEIVDRLGPGWSLNRLLTNHRALLGFPEGLEEGQLQNLISYFEKWRDDGLPPPLDPLTAQPISPVSLADAVAKLNSTSGPGGAEPDPDAPRKPRQRLMDRLTGGDKKLGMPATVSIFSRPGTVDSFLKAVYCPPGLSYAFAYNPAAHKDVGSSQISEFRRQGYRPLQMDEVTMDEDKAREEGIFCFQTFEPGPDGMVAIGGQVILVTTQENYDYIQKQIWNRSISDINGGMNKALENAEGVPSELKEMAREEWEQGMEKRRSIQGLNTDNPMDDPRLSSRR